MEKQTIMNELMIYNTLSEKEQDKCKKDIIALFREFWKLNPTEEECSKVMHGLVLYGEMLYIMVKTHENKQL